MDKENIIQKILEKGVVVQKADTDIYIQPSKSSLVKSINFIPEINTMVVTWASKDEELMTGIYQRLKDRPYYIEFVVAQNEEAPDYELWYALTLKILAHGYNPRRIVADIDEKFSLALWDKEIGRKEGQNEH